MTKKLFLLRHADRPEIPEGETGNGLLLTDEGKRNTRLFSERLDNIISIQASPVLRCVQTAEIIANSCDYDKAQIVQSTLLGNPGFLVADAEIAWKHWQEKGHELVNEYFLSGEEYWEGFHSLNDVVNDFSNTIIKQLKSSDNGIHIWVTHDTILAAYASRVLPKILNMNQWPKFLGYLEIVLNEKNGLEFSYNQSPKT